MRVMAAWNNHITIGDRGGGGGGRGREYSVFQVTGMNEGFLGV